MKKDFMEVEKPHMKAVRESVYYLKTLLLAGGQEAQNLNLEEFYKVTIDDKEYYRTQFSYLVDTSETSLWGPQKQRIYKNVFVDATDFSLKSIETSKKP